jgi:H+/Cl- antiporter ClcA
MTMPDPLAIMRSRGYVALLVLAALIGAPISAAAYFFLWLVNRLQGWLFTSIPNGLGFHGEPVWWPLLPLTLAGVLVALSLRYLPGPGGHSPADGFKAGGAPTPIELPGVISAALLTLALGVVLGPEAPLIALGGGLAALVMYVGRSPAPPQRIQVVAAAGSFAAISALLGNPLLGAFLLLEALGIGGPLATLVLLPGLLASGIGFLIFLGLDSLTGLGTFSLTLHGLPAFVRPNGAEFGWAIAIGVAAGLLGPAIQGLARVARARIGTRTLVIMPILGLVIAALAIMYAEITGHHTSDVLFSGQDQLPGLVAHSAGYTVGALVLVIVCKGLGYSLSMSSFRGGPVFPALFLGAAGGLAFGHLPGMTMVPGLAMGIGAMSASLLRLPITAVMLAAILLGSDGLASMPLVIVTVVVAYVVTSRVAPIAPPAPPAPDPGPSDPAVTTGTR